jgi:hypothetical protein
MSTIVLSVGSEAQSRPAVVLVSGLEKGRWDKPFRRPPGGS